MAYEIESNVLIVTVIAAADLSALQYTFVKLDSTGKAVACNAATDRPFGVLQNNPLSAEEASVCVIGGTKLKMAGSTVVGPIGTNASGLGALKAFGTDLTNYVVGTLITAVGAANEIGTAVINCASAGRAT
jgi:hypothetical protein